jgi:hypothetical protein
MKRFRWLMLFGVLIGGCFTAEYASYRRADPTGCVFTLSEFLAWRQWAEQFALVDVGGQQHVIAYGPAGRTFLMASGPAAYVFDARGKLVDWSPDIGDDSVFDNKWGAQRARGPGQTLSRSEVVTFAATRPTG